MEITSMSQAPITFTPDEKTEFYTDEGCHILECWNSEQDNDVSIARARVGPGITTQKHKLKNTVERYLILQGYGRIFIGDLQAQDVEVGDVVIIPANCTQSIENTGDEDLIFHCVCSPRFLAENYVKLD